MIQKAEKWEQRRKGGAHRKKCSTGLSVRIASSYKRQKPDCCGFGSRDLCDRQFRAKMTDSNKRLPRAQDPFIFLLHLAP